PPRERAQRFRTVFIAVFGVDRFTGTKFDRLARNANLLPFQAGKMHFNAMTLSVEKCVMFECIELECPTQLAIDPCQQIEIELSRDALRVVVRGIKYLGRFYEVDTDDDRRAAPQNMRR